MGCQTISYYSKSADDPSLLEQSLEAFHLRVWRRVQREQNTWKKIAKTDNTKLMSYDIYAYGTTSGAARPWVGR